MNTYTLQRAKCFEVFAVFPFTRDRLVSAGSLWVDIRLTPDEVATLATEGFNVR